MAKIIFKKIVRENIELIRRWRNSARVRLQMYSQRNITTEMQHDWFENISRDEGKHYFLCYLDGNPVGVLNFVGISDNSCSWGCYIGEERVLPGMGIALEAAALIYAFDMLRINQLNAQVLVENKGPQSMHRIFGYRKLNDRIEIVDGIEHAICQYLYTREDWALNQSSVYAKLPKPILKVIEKIEFIVD